MYDLGFGGVFVVTENVSYIYNNNQFPGCTRLNNNWKYSTQVEAYKGATALPGATLGKTLYVGECGDVGACSHFLSFYLEVVNGVIRFMNYNQKVSLAGGLICPTAQGNIEYDITTLDFNPSHRDQYFVLPPDCVSAPLDYCQLAYPAGNACAIAQKKRYIKSL